jgi:ParB-like chromosome segregation protein Spo0J
MIGVCEMQDLIIDEKFARMFPVLNERLSAELEESILEFGCVVPLIVWEGVLIDGHNRYMILKKHGLPFETVSMEFESRDLVEIWIIENQIFRRNLTPIQLSFYRGLHYHAEKRVVGNMSGRSRRNDKLAQNEPISKQQSTAEKLAEKYDVSRNTIKRDAQLANALTVIGEASPDVKMDIITGKTRISKSQLHELATGSEDDVAAVISQIEEGTHKSRRPGAGSLNGASVADGGVDAGFADMRPWEVQFAKMTDEFRQIMRRDAKIDDTDAVRESLRQYIDMLEELYQGL